MVIGDLSTNVAYGNWRLQPAPIPDRKPVTLDAQVNPQKPDEYSVAEAAPRVIPPPEKPSENKNIDKRLPKNDDPVSRAFRAVAGYEAVKHRIDLYV